LSSASGAASFANVTDLSAIRVSRGAALRQEHCAPMTDRLSDREQSKLLGTPPV
jgi:hypothetical protein